MKVKRDKIVYESAYADFVKSTYEDKKKNTKHWYWAKRKSGQSIIVVVATMDNKLVAINQFRVPINKKVWELPAGIIEKNELIEVAGSRELLEETGLSVKKIFEKSTNELYNSPGITDEVIHYMFVEAEGTLSIKDTEDSEEIKPSLLDKDDINKILKEGKDAISAKAYLIFKRFADEGVII